MAEVKYFKFLGENEYARYSADGKKIYRFKGGNHVAVDTVPDIAWFACNEDFVETDSNGKPVEPSVPSRNKPAGTPLSYVKLGDKGADDKKSASKTTVSKGKEGAKTAGDAEDDGGKAKKSSSKKKSEKDKE